MLLIVAMAVSALGFAGWVAGTIFEYPGVAFLGAVIIVGVGTMVMTTGLEYEAGHVETNVSDDETEVSNSYERVDTSTQLPLGVLWTLLPSMLGFRSLEQFSEVS